VALYLTTYSGDAMMTESPGYCMSMRLH